MQCDKKTDMLTFAAEPEDIGTRIDVCAADISDALSRSGFKKLIEEGNVLVNDKAVKANYKLRKNDIVTLIIPEAEPLEIIPQNIPLDILYEDDDVIVINKPQGMVVRTLYRYACKCSAVSLRRFAFGNKRRYASRHCS